MAQIYVTASGTYSLTFTAASATSTTQLLFEKGTYGTSYFYIDNARVAETDITTYNYFVADVVTANDYSPFGAPLAGRSYTAPNSDYRFSFNGKEKDDEVSGAGNSIAYEARIYDSRLGRFSSIDPRQGEYPWQSPYAYFSNSPISVLDILGKGGPEDEPEAAGGCGFFDSEINYIQDMAEASNDMVSEANPVGVENKSNAPKGPYNSTELYEKYTESIQTYLTDNKERLGKLISKNILPTAGNNSPKEIRARATDIISNELFNLNWNSILIDATPDPNRPDPKKGATIVLTVIDFTSLDNDFSKEPTYNKNAPKNYGNPFYTEFLGINGGETFEFVNPSDGKSYNFSIGWPRFTIFYNN